MANPVRHRPVPASRSRAAISWVSLYAAITLDVVQVFALDYSDGLTNPLLAAAAIAAFVAELSPFTVALRRITSAVAYGLYGLGTCAFAVISIAWFGEPITLPKPKFRDLGAGFSGLTCADRF